MEPIVNYVEDVETKIMKEMSVLFQKMRDQRDTMSLTGIEDMYRCEPIDGVLYEPFVRIPLTIGPRNGHYYCTDFTLPKDEYVIFRKETTHQRQNGQTWDPPTYMCIALTTHGRCFLTNPVKEICTFPTNCFEGYHPSQYTPHTILRLDPLPYKMPSRFFTIFSLAYTIGRIDLPTLHSPSNVSVQNTISDATTTKQNINKEFYLFAGKWKPHMTETATLDIDNMRQTILENTANIQELSAKNKALEAHTTHLQAEVQLLLDQKAKLEKDMAELRPLQSYKAAVIDCMETHDHTNIDYPDEERWGDEDSGFIKAFRDWYTDKVCMDKWEYDDVMESKEELNEYRIYKKVKAEMVSSGMDTSNVARSVRNIKKGVDKLNHA